MPVQPNSEFLEYGYQRMKSRAEAMAPNLDSDGAKKLTQAEVDTLWDTRAMPLEKEWELWRMTKPDGSPAYTREEIGLLVYPHRQQLAKRGGRLEPKDQIKFMNDQAKRSEARRQAAAPPMPLAPPPDPLGMPSIAPPEPSPAPMIQPPGPAEMPGLSDAEELY